MIATSESAESDVKQAIKFYADHCKRVELVSCNHCGAAQCLFVELDGGVPNTGGHPDALQRITLKDTSTRTVTDEKGKQKKEKISGDHLLGSRLRVDGVMGFLCICGNDTRVATPEFGRVGQSSRETTMQPHEVAAIEDEMIRSGWKPDVVSNGSKTRVESFTIERIK